MHGFFTFGGKGALFLVVLTLLGLIKSVLTHEFICYELHSAEEPLVEAAPLDAAEAAAPAVEEGKLGEQDVFL